MVRVISLISTTKKEDDSKMKTDEQPSAEPPKDITKLEINNYNSDANHNFRFSLSHLYRANDITLFGCECCTEDRTMIQLTGIPVDYLYMKKMREITAKHDFAKIEPGDPDAYIENPEKASVSIDLYWAGGVKKRADHLPDTGVDELLELFWDILNALMGGGGKLPLRAEDVIALSCGGRELPRGCRYELREQDDGVILFSWPGMGGDSGRDIYTYTVNVDRIYMDRLREIVDQRGVLDPKPGILKSLSPDVYLNPHEEETKPSPLEAHWKSVPLPFAQLKISKPTNGGEDLLEFFRDLAAAHAEKAETKFSHRSGPVR